MISRNALVAALGAVLALGTVADASAKTTSRTVGAPHTVTASRTIAGKHHRLHVAHRTTRHMKVARTGGKRIVVSHAVKHASPKHV